MIYLPSALAFCDPDANLFVGFVFDAAFCDLRRVEVRYYDIDRCIHASEITFSR